MDLIKRLFPLSFKAKDILGLVIYLIIYLVLPAALAFISSLLSGVPVLSTILGIIVWASGIYCFVGIVLLILAFLKIIK